MTREGLMSPRVESEPGSGSEDAQRWGMRVADM